MIKIIAIGKKHEHWIESGVLLYQKRLKKPWNIEWILLMHSDKKESTKMKKHESEYILNKISEKDFVILLDEGGKNYNSVRISEVLEQKFSQGLSPVFIIGGAYGVDDNIKNRANLTLSLSSMVFPYQLVRLILCEQIYRCQEIAIGGKYHHG